MLLIIFYEILQDFILIIILLYEFKYALIFITILSVLGGSILTYQVVTGKANLNIE